MIASSVAMQGMLAQGFGQIYNMEGFGAGGNIREGMSVYGTSKAAVRYYSKALIAEADETAVQVGILSPGMVMTDLILRQYQDKPEELEKYKRIFNIIADRVENVTPWLVNKMLANQKNGAHFQYAPSTKLAWRFISSPFNKRDVFSEKN
jgi:short-subunit dehydrogenase